MAWTRTSQHTRGRATQRYRPHITSHTQQPEGGVRATRTEDTECRHAAHCPLSTVRGCSGWHIQAQAQGRHTAVWARSGRRNSAAAARRALARTCGGSGANDRMPHMSSMSMDACDVMGTNTRHEVSSAINRRNKATWRRKRAMNGPSYAVGWIYSLTNHLLPHSVRTVLSSPPPWCASLLLLCAAHTRTFAPAFPPVHEKCTDAPMWGRKIAVTPGTGVHEAVVAAPAAVLPAVRRLCRCRCFCAVFSVL